MMIDTFVPVVQRRRLRIEARLLPLLEPLFVIETHLSFEERLTLFQKATELPRGFVACEVGSYLGASAAFLAAGATLRDGRVYCVDTWDNRAMGAEPPEDTFARFRANTHPFRHYLSVHRGVTADSVGSVPEGLDLLFLDGDHGYEAVRSDLSHYAPKLKAGGLLVLHDYDFESVRRACEEFLAGRAVVDRGAVHALKVFQMG